MKKLLQLERINPINHQQVLIGHNIEALNLISLMLPKHPVFRVLPAYPGTLSATSLITDF